jgi:hypothetical protein
MNDERIQPQVRDRHSASDEDSADDVVPNIRSLEPSAHEVFVAWEERRLLFNVLIVGPCILLMTAILWPFGFSRGDIAADLIVSNLFFSTGFVAEGYLSVLGLNRNTSRRYVFLGWCFITSIWLLVGAGVWHVNR